ncbi:unnamed protein product [marine sediment metagenome]|uniref:PEGA domain-containing protein n=1 Tax=marine sediment metagenome TaxID=412755 RepID=X1T919_9ZZZZ
MSIKLVGGLNPLDVSLIPVYVPPPTATLQGTVTEAVTGYGIAGVLVEVIGTAFSDYTNTSGDYSIANIPVGTYTIHFSKEGYDPLTV